MAAKMDPAAVASLTSASHRSACDLVSSPSPLCEHAGVDDNGDAVEEVAALRAALLRDHERFLAETPSPRNQRRFDRIARLHLSWLFIPWFLAGMVRFYLFGAGRRWIADQQETARLYRQLSGRDPGVARAEVQRIDWQFRELDQRFQDLDEERPGLERGGEPRRSRHRADPALAGQLLEAGDRYREAWRRWFDRRVERGSPADPPAR
jgi:hypothetical protein